MNGLQETIIRPILCLSLAIVLLSSDVSNGQATTNLAAQIEWPGFNDAFTAAKKSKKIVLIDVWSSTCGWCRKQQTEVYTQPDLQKFLFNKFELGRLNLDITDDTLSFRGYTLSSQMLAGGLGATGTPTAVFMEADGAYITRLQGFHAYEDFYDVLRFIGSESFREMSFEEFMAEPKK
mgnify:CR=1 FL=1